MTTPPATNLVSVYARWDQEFVLPYYAGETSNINPMGAMGTNRLNVSIGVYQGASYVNAMRPWGYYTPFSQRHSSKWMSLALVLEDLERLEKAIKTIEYTFKFQDYGGRNPLGLSPTYGDGRLPVIPTPVTPSTNELELLGAMVFFLADVQHTLHLAAASSWFNEAEETAGHRARLAALHPQIKAAIRFLDDPAVDGTGLNRRERLARNDSINPNRVLQHGLMYYGMGRYYNNRRWTTWGRQLLALGLKFQVRTLDDAFRSPAGIISKPGYEASPYVAFAKTAAEIRATPVGYFCESGGPDSSYNNACLLFLFRYFSIMPESEKYARDIVWRAAVAAVRWQMRTLQADYSYSLEGNTRVTDGGEQYNGKTKTVNVLEAVYALAMYAALSGDARMKDIAFNVLKYSTARVMFPRSEMSTYAKTVAKLQSGDLSPASGEVYASVIQIAAPGKSIRQYPHVPDFDQHEFVSDISPYSFAGSRGPDAPIGREAAPVDGVTFAGGVCTITGGALLEQVQPMLDRVEMGAVVLYRAGESDATSELLAYSQDVQGLFYGPQGSDIRVQFTSNDPSIPGTGGVAFRY